LTHYRCFTDFPDAPSAVTVRRRTSTIICLDVNEPADDGGEHIIGYRIDYDQGRVLEFQTGMCITAVICTLTFWRSLLSYGYSYKASCAAVSVVDEDICIEDLHPLTPYIFQVRARNEVGVGLQKRITVTTDDVRKFSKLTSCNLVW